MSPPLKHASWMLLRLGLETQQHHAIADEDRLALMDVRSPADYRAQLARIYGFEAAVEAALTPFVDARERAKAHWLRHDLQWFGLTGADVAALPRATINIGSLTQALGWLFVVERHTLVSGVIRRQLEHRFGPQLHDATRYLAAAGATPGARFRSLCVQLDEHASLRANAPAMLVASASEAFRCQRLWYMTAPDRELGAGSYRSERSVAIS